MSQRIHFVDGPLDGTTSMVEGDPPTEWLTAGLHASTIQPADDATGPGFVRHRYMRTYRTRQGKTWVYEYDGVQT